MMPAPANPLAMLGFSSPECSPGTRADGLKLVLLIVGLIAVAIARLLLSLLNRDDNIAEDTRLRRQIFIGREGQNVGGIILVAILAVELAHLGVACPA